MVSKLLSHEWKALRRSSFWTQSLVQTIILSLFGLYFILMAIGIGFGAGPLVEEFFPQENVVKVFTSFFLVYLLMDLITRFMLQKFPSIALNKYLTLNIKKSSLSHFVILKSIPSFFNALPLFAILPFFYSYVLANLGTKAALQWLITMALLVLLNNFLSYLLDRIFGKQPLISFVLLGIVSTALFLDFKGIIPLRQWFFTFYESGFSSILFLVFIIGVLSTVYYFLYKFLRSNAYLETGAVDENSTHSTQAFTIFNRFGDIGKWMQLEAKLIWRNKRPRQYFIMSCVFLFYPFLMGLDSFNSRAMMIFIGLFITGAFALNYGQLLLSWNSSHFDMILTQNFPLKKYLKAKYYLLALSCFVFGILSLPYVFFNITFMSIALAMCLFNIGVTIPIYMFLAVYDSRKIDTAAGGAFSFEGFGAAHYLIMIPIMAIPMIIYAICKALGHPNLGIFLLGLIGILGIVFHDYILQKVIQQFHKKKYILQTNLSK